MRMRFSALVVSSAALAFTAALIMPVAAHADTDTFTVTGTDYSFSFDLPSTFPTGVADYSFNNVAVNYGGNIFDATVTFYDRTDFAVQDATDYAGYGSIADSGYFSTTGDTNTFNLGSIPSYGSVNCLSSLTMPGMRSMPTLALLQMPTFGTVCGDPTTVQISPASTPISPTPEPASLLLLGTGALGVLSLGTRRLWS